ncbi:hypothetical protein T484DRAFT_1978585 [Baffinella frigidus]|nr:hypothetical protein T484DRAFT_1978585 [Cryptophyta sp. CCMP2293]
MLVMMRRAAMTRMLRAPPARVSTPWRTFTITRRVTVTRIPPAIIVVVPRMPPIFMCVVPRMPPVGMAAMLRMSPVRALPMRRSVIPRPLAVQSCRSLVPEVVSSRGLSAQPPVNRARKLRGRAHGPAHPPRRFTPNPPS